MKDEDQSVPSLLRKEKLKENEKQAIWIYQINLSQGDSENNESWPGPPAPEFGIVFPRGYRPRELPTYSPYPNPDLVNPSGTNIYQIAIFRNYRSDDQLVVKRYVLQTDPFYENQNREFGRYGILLWFIANSDETTKDCMVVGPGPGGLDPYNGSNLFPLKVPAT